MIEINTGVIGQDQWMHSASELVNHGNLICVTKPSFKTSDYNPLIWFGTNLAQFLTKDGNSEICPIFGGQVNNINDFAYQLCRTIPWGFEMGRSLNAVYDVILNFTTEPKNRYFIWHDAQHLFRHNKELFEHLFEYMIVASYLNSNGQGTHDYKVNQKVIFLFDDTNEQEVEELMSKTYYTPSVYDDATKGECDLLHKQTLILVK